MHPLIEKLSREEKAALLQGWSDWTTREIKHLGIPPMFLADGPHGLRRQENLSDPLGLNPSLPATCFPTAATMANSWDTELGEKLGRALGVEAAAQGVHVVLGPGLNIKRSPLCGRNFEYFSEDPFLAGKMAAAYVRGIQENGVAACPKHFAVNSQELRRMAMDAVVDERSLREIYLTGFEIAVKEGKPKVIMSAYNQVNGTYANENAQLLRDILRKEWGFEGFVVSDWGADNDHVEGVRAGSALVMPDPGPGCAAELVAAVKAGLLEEEVLDERLNELLPIIFSTHEAVENASKTVDWDAHHLLAKQCAAQSVVLLDNDGTLPLDISNPVAVIGDFAREPRFQGSGSSRVHPTRVDDFLTCAREAGMKFSGFAQGYLRRNPEPDLDLISEAVMLAAKSDTVLLFVGLDERSECEGVDRTHLRLPDSQMALIRAVARLNRHLVLVLCGGAPFLMPPRDTYSAAVHGYLGGQAGAAALVDVLLGTVNPSGHLAETWPLAEKDTPAHCYYPSREKTSEYREGLYVGYRYYDTAGVPVCYPFGHGLSYTEFAYSHLELDGQQVSFTLENIGQRDGAAVPQVYVSRTNGQVFRPKKELKGFCKVFLKAGEAKRIEISLDDKAFRYFNVKTDKWEVEGGAYEISVCSDAATVLLSGTTEVPGTNAPKPYPELPSYESGRIAQVSDGEFEKLLGHSIPKSSWDRKLDVNDALCRLEGAKSPIGRWLYTVLKKNVDETLKSGSPDLNPLFIYNMPFRAIAKMKGHWVSMEMAEDVVYFMNGHFFRGLARLLVHFVSHRRTCRKFVQRLEKAERDANS